MKKILVVEDGDFDYLMVEKALSDSYKVIWKKSVEESLKFFETSECDLVILDLDLGDGLGLEICQKLRASPSTESLPIIIVSSLDSTDDKVHGLQLGADDYVTKPFNGAELKARVARKLNIQ